VDDLHEDVESKGRVEICFMDDVLYLAYEGRSRFKVVGNIPKGDYRPCISIGFPGVRLRISVHTPGKKRAAPSDSQESLNASKRLWVDRAFTDAEVMCGQKRIPVKTVLIRCLLI
jgi:hypothetical protein